MPILIFIDAVIVITFVIAGLDALSLPSDLFSSDF